LMFRLILGIDKKEALTKRGPNLKAISWNSSYRKDHCNTGEIALVPSLSPWPLSRDPNVQFTWELFLHVSTCS
jgi:hypothetical protein